MTLDCAIPQSKHAKYSSFPCCDPVPLPRSPPKPRLASTTRTDPYPTICPQHPQWMPDGLILYTNLPSCQEVFVGRRVEAAAATYRMKETVVSKDRAWHGHDGSLFQPPMLTATTGSDLMAGLSAALSARGVFAAHRRPYRNSTRQIMSPRPAERLPEHADLQANPKNGPCWNRTNNLGLKRPLLCQLS
jgi:hypothetical protein